MFSENPFNSIALVLAILAYLGAVRLAIRQRLSEVRRRMMKIEGKQPAGAAHPSKKLADEWQGLRHSAQRHSTAVTLLIPADIMLIFVAFMLLLTPFRGSLTIAIDGGLILGAAWLAGLHAYQWLSGITPATRANEPPELVAGAKPPSSDETARANRDAEKKWETDEKNNALPFCDPRHYFLAVTAPLVILVGLLVASFSYKHVLPGDAAAHYHRGRRLYERGRFDAAIVQHQHAIRIERGRAQYRYALARALSSRNAEYSPLAALTRAIEFDSRFRDQAKTERAFDPIRDDPAFRKLVYDESPIALDHPLRPADHSQTAAGHALRAADRRRTAH